ncbi:hypothetical protein BC830DRAFT_1175186 [Chytriomyces sp. MP71]|nr:hypothetical protein BC830DRAFT_1175186 [Chytriomyces sp. MP71]
MTHRPPGSIIWSRETPHTPPTPQMGPTDDRPYFSRKQLATFVDANWERFWLKPRATTWQQSLMSALIGGGGGNSNTVVGVAELRYLTGREQFPGDNAAQSLISLFHRDKLPSAIEAKRNRAPAYDIATNGCLMELGATAPPPPRVFSSTSAPPAPGGGAKKKESAPKRLLEISGGPSAGGGESDNESAGSRKRGGSVTPELRGNTDPTKKPANGGSRSVYRPRPQPRVLEAEEVDPNNSVLLYPDLNNPPNGPVTLSFEVTNTAPQMRVSANGLSVFTEKGYRMSKATHGVYEGCWYYELSFHPEEKGHARVGWSQISGDLQAPCGYDQFSYSYRDSPGTLFHQSMHVKGPEAYADGFKEGDVLGIMITLPTPTDMDNLVRRLWRLDSSYVQFRTKLMEKLPGSEIRYFKNGVDLGVAFTDLYQGKYYPAVSSYMSGTVTLNFGPTFKHALPNGARAYSDVPKVLAWADLALYSYEPFYVADREPARSAPAIATLGVHLGASPKRRERDFSYNGGGSFGARRTGTKKKKRSLVKKSAIVSAAAVAAGTGDVEVSNDVSVAVTVPLAQEGDEKAVSGELAEDMDEDDAGELEDGEGDSDAESHETPMSDAGEKEIVGGVDATLSL